MDCLQPALSSRVSAGYVDMLVWVSASLTVLIDPLPAVCGSGWAEEGPSDSEQLGDTAYAE